MSEKFPEVSGIGGYGIVYVGDGVVFCGKCAEKQDKDVQDSLKGDIHYEGSSFYCGDCGKELESEYGEVDE